MVVSEKLCWFYLRFLTASCSQVVLIKLFSFSIRYDLNLFKWSSISKQLCVFYWVFAMKNELFSWVSKQLLIFYKGGYHSRLNNPSACVEDYYRLQTIPNVQQFSTASLP